METFHVELIHAFQHLSRHPVGVSASRIWNPGEHRWNADLDSTQMNTEGHRWNADGTNLERRWKSHGTQRNPDGTQIERER